MRRAFTVGAVSAALLLVFPTSSQAKARSRSVTTVSHGVRLTLIVPARSYTRGEIIGAVVRTRNISRHTIRLDGYPSWCWAANYSGSNPIIVVFNGAGKTVFPPRTPKSPHCSAVRPYVLRPGRAIRTFLYVPARGSWLMASVRLVHRVKVRTSRLKIHLR